MRTIRSFQTADNRFKNTTIKFCLWIQGLGYFKDLYRNKNQRGRDFLFESGVNVFYT